MKDRKTSVIENGLIWFGAAVSIAEILTGTYFAPLGFSRGILAILTGHIIGCVMLFLAGLIGAETGKSAMETTKISFGQKGGIIFSVLNILQLVGWTAIMIYDGSLAADDIWPIGRWIWCIIIGGMIIIWIAVGIKNLGKVNTVAISALFILTIVISTAVFKSGNTASEISDELTFGAAVELSAAMPLSWLPLISDYTCEAEKPVKATAVSAIVYGIVSFWMYMIGMGAAIFTGEYDIASIIMKAGLGIIGLIVVVFSTVTTTFMDAYSAGISCESITGKADSKFIAIGTAVLGTIAAVIYPMDNIADFLYLIGSVFAPMIAVLTADFFILKKKEGIKGFDWISIIAWAAGFVIYRLLMKIDFVLGNTLLDMVITGLITVLAEKIFSVQKQTKQ